MKKQMTDCVSLPSGEFEMLIMQGNIQIDRVFIPNLVVDRAKFTMSRLLGNDNISSRIISKVGFGIGTTPPVAGDTGLENELIEKVLDSVSYPSDKSVVFASTLSADEGNAGGPSGVMYYEAGLKCLNGDLFSRVVYTGRPKNTKIAFIVRWRIYWT